MLTRKPCATEPFKSRVCGDLSPTDIATIITKCCKVTLSSPLKGGAHYAFFTPHAQKSLYATIHYGKWVAENELESQYFLEGYYFINERNETSTVVTNIVTPYSAVQGKASAQLYSKDNNSYKIVEQKEAELTKYASCGKDNANGSKINPFFEKYGPPIRVGFGHTHPNIGVFFSSVDETSIFAAYGEPWITMVADPRREELLVAVGANMETASIVMFDDASQPIELNNPCVPEKHNGDLMKLIKIVDELINSGNTVKIRINGFLPDKLRIKGIFIRPTPKLKKKPLRKEK